MKHIHKILCALLSATLLFGAVGCGRGGEAAQPEGDKPPVGMLLSDIPKKDRPQTSDPRAIEAHGVTMTATYTVPNGVVLSVAMRDGADRGSLTLSWLPLFEQYKNGTWVRMLGQEDVDQRATMDTSHFMAPYEMMYGMPRFPEAGVYRCVILCGGEVTAEHYAYFEVPTYTLTEPTDGECPAFDAESAPLTVRAEEITPNGLTLVLNSATGEKVSLLYGAPYYLSCHIDGEWKPVSGDSDFIAIAYMLELEGEQKLPCVFGRTIAPLGAGHYRYAKKFGDVTYYVYFEIEG